MFFSLYCFSSIPLGYVYFFVFLLVLLNVIKDIEGTGVGSFSKRGGL